MRELVYRGDVSRLLEQRRAEGELERAQVEVRTSILDLSGDLSAARRDRDQRSAGLLSQAEAAKAGFRARLEAQKAELARQAELQRQATAAKDAFRQERDATLQREERERQTKSVRESPTPKKDNDRGRGR